MRRAFCGVVLAATFLLPAGALAKPGHGYEPDIAQPPSGIRSGITWNDTISFSGKIPEHVYVRISRAANEASRVFVAEAAGSGAFVARVVFPSAGIWQVEVLSPPASWPAGTLRVDPVPVLRHAGFPAIPTAAGGLAATLGLVLSMKLRRRSTPVS